jgi:hypothetical protein
VDKGEERGEDFDGFLAVWESFSAGGMEAETDRRRVMAAVTGGVELIDGTLTWRARTFTV